MPRRMVVITGLQRSGTTALGEVLGRATRALWCGEVFHHIGSGVDSALPDTQEVQEQFNFFRFRAGLFRDDPTLTVPMPHHQARILKAFLDHLVAQSPNKRVILDIKYNSFHHLNPVWSDLCGEPLMLKKFKVRKVPIIHVVRRNQLERYVSFKVAEQRQHYHFRSGAAVPPGQVKLDLAETIEALRRAEHQIERFRTFLADYEPVVELAYEEMFSANRLSESAREQLGELLRMRLRDLELAFVKATAPPSEMVSNWAEIRDGVADSGLGHLLEHSVGRVS